jgi:CHASE3 domain sensor protein
MTLEQLVAFVDTSSRNEVIKKKKLDYYLVARDMYKRLNDEEKEKFLLFDSKTQDKIIRIFIEETKKTINKEIKEINEINKSNDNIKNNEIKEKTILQKYLLFIIIGVIIIFCVFIVLINENKKL